MARQQQKRVIASSEAQPSFALQLVAALLATAVAAMALLHISADISTPSIDAYLIAMLGDGT